MTQEVTDTELMARLKAGDEQAFATLFQRHYKRVLNTAYRFIGSDAEADDIAQEAFLRVYRAAHRYEPRALFTTWLYQIVTNLCLNWRRSKGRSRLRYVAGAPGVGGETSQFNPVDAAADSQQGEGFEGLVEEERARIVRECLDELPPNQRLALILMHYEGQSHEEIAGVLGINANAAKQLCHRAREKLREMLAVRMKDK